MGSEMQPIIDDMLVRWMALTAHLANESIGPNGERCCCVCGATAALSNVPGCPGVYHCRECAP